ncbi:MAG: hypothetical protein HDR14_16340 [Lachnospiraceae bacterium]|nr:hypothetical protein [Lachnospiraceae bacterium]
MHKARCISTILNEVPKVGTSFRGEIIVKVKKISSGSDFMAECYKIVTKGKYGRRRKFFVHITAAATSFHYGRLH